MTIAACVLAVAALVALLLGLTVTPGGHHCCIGWTDPPPGYVVPTSVDPHWVWRHHTGCDTSCRWKVAALTALWKAGRMKPDPRIEPHLRGHK